MLDAYIPVLLFVIISGARSLEFTSEEKLWTLELSRNPDSRVAMAGIAVVRMQQHRYAEARPEGLRKAITSAFNG